MPGQPRRHSGKASLRRWLPGSCADTGMHTMSGGVMEGACTVYVTGLFLSMMRGAGVASRPLCRYTRPKTPPHTTRDKQDQRPPVHCQSRLLHPKRTPHTTLFACHASAQSAGRSRSPKQRKTPSGATWLVVLSALEHAGNQDDALKPHHVACGGSHKLVMHGIDLDWLKSHIP